MRRRTLVLASGGALLTACGGGGPSGAPARLALFGDSLSSNNALPVKTAQLLRDALPGVMVDDWSRASMRAIDAADLVRKVLVETRPNVVLLLYGGADVIGQTPPAEFGRTLGAEVGEVLAASAKVVLASVIRHPAYLVAVEAINAEIWRIGREAGVAVADVFGLGTGDFQEDLIHPGPVWNGSRAALLADTTRRVLQ